ncbi:MAG: amidohydrolase family protein [Acidimicrobiales bacterium]
MHDLDRPPLPPPAAGRRSPRRGDRGGARSGPAIPPDLRVDEPLGEGRGLPPDGAVRDEDDILAESARHVARWHDPSHGAMVRIALAPCSPFTVTPDLMRRTAELAEQLDVRLHTHLAENAEDDEFAVATFGKRPVDLYEDVGWMTDRTWGAHVVRPNPRRCTASVRPVSASLTARAPT